MDSETIAYFSMEIALEEGIPTYSGGLGILAGDTLRAAADLKLPLAAITLLYRKGYFYQKLNSKGIQSEMPVEWIAPDFLQEPLKVIEICNAKYASQVLNKDVKISLTLPSPISVYVEADKTYISLMLPNSIVQFFQPLGLKVSLRKLKISHLKIIEESKSKSSKLEGFHS